MVHTHNVSISVIILEMVPFKYTHYTENQLIGAMAAAAVAIAVDAVAAIVFGRFFFCSIVTLFSVINREKTMLIFLLSRDSFILLSTPY